MSSQKITYRDYFYVGVQLLLFVGYVLPLRITQISLPEWLCYLGLGLCVLGTILGAVALFQINTKLSPFPTPVSNGKLITNGAFAISRHPIYTAIILVSLGYGIFQQSAYKLLIFLVLIFLFYFKSEYEERLLIEKFKAYSEYKNQVGRFLPKIKFS